MLQLKDNPLQISFIEKKSHVEIDAFGNIYIINNNEIIKYNSVGVLQKKFSTKRYGKIDFVDANVALPIDQILLPFLVKRQKMSI